MPVQKITREEILKKAMRLFKRQGYHRTSMDDLAKECGVLKGSFYYYFSSKEALMKEVLQYVNAYNKAHVLTIAYEEAIPPKQRLEQLLDALFDVLFQSEGGCLMGNTVLETALITDEFKEPLQTHFNNIINAVAHIYQHVYSPQKAVELAQQLAIDIQGSLVMIKLFGNEKLLLNCRERALKHLENTKSN
ncbi:TetR/AcrR family transcriptional regulator [Tellurirhabdus bombi]|uniref:TetR/AcrR family transcriptional regulator n=1 Tax=Tellurirhabdus bombi TaxID=2907205 RepID=UPI001F35BA47|nr:TetR/AcrR family transcriptional regulator [Tellurirhabdus bombi]